MKANIDIRKQLQKYKIAYWKLGSKLGVHENTITRKMRVELSPEAKKQFLGAIENIVTEEGGTYE